MKVLFASFPALNLMEGGAKTQLLMSKKYLEKLGVGVEIFKEFTDYNLKEFDLFHLFATEGATYHLGKVIKGLRVKLVVSPIFYSRYSPTILSLLTSFPPFPPSVLRYLDRTYLRQRTMLIGGHRRS